LEPIAPRASRRRVLSGVALAALAGATALLAVLFVQRSLPGPVQWMRAEPPVALAHEEVASEEPQGALAPSEDTAPLEAPSGAPAPAALRGALIKGAATTRKPL